MNNLNNILFGNRNRDLFLRKASLDSRTSRIKNNR